MAGRNSNGQFVKGVSGNPGGRPKSQPEYLDYLRQALTPEKWQAIVDRAITDATNGDRYARQWLSDYAVGPPPKEITVSGSLGITVDEWRQQATDRLQAALATMEEEAGHD